MKHDTEETAQRNDLLMRRFVAASASLIWTIMFLCVVPPGPASFLMLLWGAGTTYRMLMLWTKGF